MSSLFRKLVLVAAAAFVVAACSKENADPAPAPVDEGPKAGEFIGVVGEPRTVTKDEIVGSAVDIFRSLAGLPESMAALVQAFVGGLIPDDVVLTNVEYYTTGVDGVTKASGVLAWPLAAQTEGKYDAIVSVSHATCDIDAAPSLQRFPVEAAPVFHGSRKQVIALADYLGYGSSRTPDLQHPYLSTRLTGSTNADLLQAAEAYLASEGKMTCSQDVCPIQVCGYSQGGHGAIATMFELEKRGLGDRILRVDAGAGPQDISAMISGFRALQGKSFGAMGLIPYAIRGAIYAGGLNVDLNNIFAPEVMKKNQNGEAIADIFSTRMLSTWHSALGRDITKVLHSDFLKTDKSQMNADLQTLMAAMDSDSAINYAKPQNAGKITLYHETNDELVPYVCSANAHSKWSGSTLVDLQIASNNHSLGAVEFYLRLLDDNAAVIWGQVYQLLKMYSGM